VPPDAITAVTFTNKAAKEMRQRLRARLKEKVKGLRICTFHALGLNIVREHAEHVGRREHVSVFSPSEQRALIRNVLQDRGLAHDHEACKRMQAMISQAKNGQGKDIEALQGIRAQYDTLLQQMNAVDFDDLLLLPLQLLQQNDTIRALWQARSRHLLIDEYQDSSAIQYALIRLLSGKHSYLTVVGDDDQSIYGWRGAEVRNLFMLERDYQDLNVIRLEENYRSTASILQASNTLIAHNSGRMGKSLRANLGKGKPVRIWEAETTTDEAKRIASDIRAQARTQGLQWHQFAVLYRASHRSRDLELALRQQKIPYHVSGGLSFFERAEVSDVLAWLRLIVNPRDDAAFLRAIARPKRGIGEKTLSLLSAAAAKKQQGLLEAAQQYPSDMRGALALHEFSSTIAWLRQQLYQNQPEAMMRLLLHKTGLQELMQNEAKDEHQYQRKQLNIDTLCKAWEEHEQLSAFLQHISLLSDKDDDASEQVRLMTIHAAKGLEFEHVYVVGVEAGGFPHRHAVDEGRLEEERRLMYVAMTRAQHRLTLSYSTSRRYQGRTERCAPSMFLKELGHEGIEWVDKEPDSESAQEEAADAMARMRAMLGLDT